MQKPKFDTKKEIQTIIRVNHAGEYGAKRIYQGQLDATKYKNEEIIHMYEQEIVHLKYFESELSKKHIRPTILSPFWHIFGYMLGYIPAKLSIKKAMVCTDAVEEVIDNHYQGQLDILNKIDSEKELAQKIKKFQEEENQHRDIAGDYINSVGLGDIVLKKITKIFCTIAINLSKRF